MVKVRDPLREAATAVGRMEADAIRFETTRLESGLFRHDPCKYVFELNRAKSIYRDDAGR